MRLLKFLLIFTLLVFVVPEDITVHIEDFKRILPYRQFGFIEKSFEHESEKVVEYNRYLEKIGKYLLQDMEITQEFKDLMQLFTPFYDDPKQLFHPQYIDYMWMVTSQVPSSGVSSDLDKMVEFMMSILPKQELRELNAKKMKESKLFADYVILLKSDELREALNKLGRSPSLQRYFIKLNALGYDEYKWIEYKRECLGIF